MILSKRFFLPLILCTAAFAAKAQSGYNIKVKFTGLKDTVAYLGNYYGDKQYLQDTSRIDKNGLVVFSGKEKLPGGLYLVVTPRKTYFEIVVDKEQNFSLETDTADFIGSMKIKGSMDNELFYEYLRNGVTMQKQLMDLNKSLADKKTKADSTAVFDQSKAINKQLEDYRSNFATKHPNTLLAKLFNAIPEPTIPEAPVLPNGRKDSTFAYRFYRAHFLDNVDLDDDRLLRTPIYHQKLNKYFTQVIPQIPDTISMEAVKITERAKSNPETFKYAVWWLTYHYETSKIMGMDAVFVHMVEKYYMTNQVTWVDSAQRVKIIQRAKDLAPTMLGNKAPALPLRDMYLNKVSTDEIKNPYVVMIFWDPTCGHCKKEIPKLDSLYKKSLKAMGVEVIAINLEGDQKQWMDYVKEHELEWINLWDPYNESKFREKYDIKSTPVVFVLDKERKIRAKRISVEQVGEVLPKFMEMDKKSSP
ncbi:MAG TPA: thioredoxin-like domain-containing protein [Chitinophagales bacterium]|nr:thioredoxin-like domain-containing protein [Chitinophagales bacterium]